MKPETVKHLLEYEEIKLSIKEKEARLEELKPLILPEIPADKEIEAKYGSFTLKAKSKWKYSDATTTLEKEVKERKKTEEADGTAEQLPGTPYIEYRSKE